MRSIIILIVVVSVSSSKNTFDHHENDGHSEAEHARLWKYFSKNTFQTPPTVRDAMDVVKPSENNNRGAFNLGGIDPLFRSFYKMSALNVNWRTHATGYLATGCFINKFMRGVRSIENCCFSSRI